MLTHTSCVLRFMDPLAGGSDDSSASSSSDSEAEQGAKRPRPAAKPQNPETQLDLEALASGASVLFVPEPKRDAESNWEW